ncbi:hypothetical protein [Nocardia spumae]|uniref:hypothetical protein n=1 Tax=Nocardia spumae TaxID=2887190 RepID=UPI001D14AD9F|nr:hypothetical protein [Nocardia spumae]
MTSNEPRDQLAKYCTDFIEGYAWADTGEEAAKHIETVLGWHPPPRVIESASAMQDERHGTVVRFRNGVVGAVDTGGGEWPGRVMTLQNPVYYWHLDDSDSGLFPALVLWEPEEAHRG